jgi:hypothetical protein
MWEDILGKLFLELLQLLLKFIEMDGEIRVIKGRREGVVFRNQVF